MARRASGTSGMTAHVALLRGINVGGKHKLPMADLVRMFSDAGCASVGAYIQSGNIVFQPRGSEIARIVERIGDQIEKQFGFRSPIITRTGAQMAHIARANPFLKKGMDVATLFVAFLESTPSAARVARLDPARSPDDRFVVDGDEIYLHFPHGVSGSKLTNAYLDSTLGVISTIRNWRTVLKLTEMSAALS